MITTIETSFLCLFNAQVSMHIKFIKSKSKIFKNDKIMSVNNISIAYKANDNR